MKKLILVGVLAPYLSDNIFGMNIQNSTSDDSRRQIMEIMASMNEQYEQEIVTLMTKIAKLIADQETLLRNREREPSDRFPCFPGPSPMDPREMKAREAERARLQGLIDKKNHRIDNLDKIYIHPYRPKIIENHLVMGSDYYAFCRGKSNAEREIPKLKAEVASLERLRDSL